MVELTSGRAGNDLSEMKRLNDKQVHPHIIRADYGSLVLCSKVKLLILGWLTLINVQVREAVVGSLLRGWQQYHVITGGVNGMAVHVEHNTCVPNGG